MLESRARQETREPPPLVGLVPSGGLGLSVLRSMATLALVRQRSLPDLLEHPVEGAIELAVGTAAREAAGRAASSVSWSLGLRGTTQRAAIFAAEALAEGLAYDLYERHVHGRRPRRARGYLKPRFRDAASGLVLAGVSTAGLTWASRESRTRKLTLPPRSTLYCYADEKKIQAFTQDGIPAETYLTSMFDTSRSRVYASLALPANPGLVARIRTLWPVEVRRRPIAADFGRPGGGEEFITQSHWPRWMFVIASVHRLSEAANQPRRHPPGGNASTVLR